MTRPSSSSSIVSSVNTAPFTSPNPEEVNRLHRYDDVDASPEAHHHTLGIENEQASPGHHVHNGRDSKLLAGYVTKAATSVGGSRGDGTALANLLNVLAGAGIIKNDTVV